MPVGFKQRDALLQEMLVIMGMSIFEKQPDIFSVKTRAS